MFDMGHDNGRLNIITGVISVVGVVALALALTVHRAPATSLANRRGSHKTTPTTTSVPRAATTTTTTQPVVVTPNFVRDPVVAAMQVGQMIATGASESSVTGNASISDLMYAGRYFSLSDSQRSHLDPSLQFTFKDGADPAGPYPELVVTNGSSTACVSITVGASGPTVASAPCW